MRQHLEEHLALALTIALLAMALALVATLPARGESEATTTATITLTTPEGDLVWSTSEVFQSPDGRVEVRIGASPSPESEKMALAIRERAQRTLLEARRELEAAKKNAESVRREVETIRAQSPRTLSAAAQERVKSALERAEQAEEAARERLSAVEKRVVEATRSDAEAKSAESHRVEVQGRMVQAQDHFLSERLNDLQKQIDTLTDRVRDLTEKGTPAARVEADMLKRQIQALEGQKRMLQPMVGMGDMGGGMMGGYGPGGMGFPGGYGGGFGGYGMMGPGIGIPPHPEGAGGQVPPGFEGVPGFAASQMESPRPAAPISREQLTEILSDVLGEEGADDLDLLTGDPRWVRQMGLRVQALREQGETEDAERELGFLRFDVKTDLLEARSNVLGEALRLNDPSPAERARQHRELREMLERIFERRQEQREREARAIAEELERIRTLIDRRQQNREVIIDRRMRELTGDRDLLVW